MSTRANVVIAYNDRTIGASSELWLSHHYDGYVRGVGEAIVGAVHACRLYVARGSDLERLWDMFPPDFENVTGLQEEIEFLYRVTYADNTVTVVARHGGIAAASAPEHYSRAHDTPDNSVELYTATFGGDGEKHLVSFGYDIREPESYIRTVLPEDQPEARAWRGRLGQRRGRA